MKLSEALANKPEYIQLFESNSISSKPELINEDMTLNEGFLDKLGKAIEKVADKAKSLGRKISIPSKLPDRFKFGLIGKDVQLVDTLESVKTPYIVYTGAVSFKAMMNSFINEVLGTKDLGSHADKYRFKSEDIPNDVIAKLQKLVDEFALEFAGAYALDAGKRVSAVKAFIRVTKDNEHHVYAALPGNDFFDAFFDNNHYEKLYQFVSNYVNSSDVQHFIEEGLLGLMEICGIVEKAKGLPKVKKQKPAQKTQS